MGKIQVFFLPYAGGSSFSFMKVIRFLKPEIEAITIEYAGRGKRKEESFINTYEEFLADTVRKIEEMRNDKLPYAIFGYSMGSVLGFDICSKKMLDTDPVHCFFCAEGSVVSPNPARHYASLSEDEFKRKIIGLGGISTRMLENPEIFEESIKLIMVDHRVLGQFRYEGQRVSCPCSILYGKNDLTCIHMEEWKGVVDNHLEYHKFEGDHFFINHQFRFVADIINLKI